MTYGENHRQKMASEHETEWRALNRVDRRKSHRAMAALMLGVIIILASVLLFELFK